MRKVNNPCTRKYKHHCFLPCGNSTSPRLMFLSLKLVIGGHEPTIMHNAPSWSHYLLLGQTINSNGEHARITQGHKYKRGESNILLNHNLNIVSLSIRSQQTQHSNNKKITYVHRSCRAAHEV